MHDVASIIIIIIIIWLCVFALCKLFIHKQQQLQLYKVLPADHAFIYSTSPLLLWLRLNRIHSQLWLLSDFFLWCKTTHSYHHSSAVFREMKFSPFLTASSTHRCCCCCCCSWKWRSWMTQCFSILHTYQVHDVLWIRFFFLSIFTIHAFILENSFTMSLTITWQHKILIKVIYRHRRRELYVAYCIMFCKFAIQ